MPSHERMRWRSVAIFFSAFFRAEAREERYPFLRLSRLLSAMAAS